MNALVLLAGLHPPEKEDKRIPVKFPPPPEGLLCGGLLLQVIIKLQQAFKPSHRQAPSAGDPHSYTAAAQGSFDMGHR